MRASRRLGMLRGYFGPRDFGIPFTTVARGVVRPTVGLIARRHVEGAQLCGRFVKLQIRGIERPLMWPATLPLTDLNQVVTEIFDSSDWHQYEASETPVLDGDVVLDCGAAEGLFALKVHRRAERVIAFEPAPVFIDSLTATFHDSNVEIVPAALGASVGKARLAGDSLSVSIGGRNAGIEVDVTTVDAWLKGARVDYIKADVEGAELDVLRGARESIKKWHPRIAITVYHSENDWREMLAYLRELVPDYKHAVSGLLFDAGAARPIMLHVWPPSRSLDLVAH